MAVSLVGGNPSSEWFQNPMRFHKKWRPMKRTQPSIESRFQFELSTRKLQDVCSKGVVVVAAIQFSLFLDSANCSVKIAI